MYQEKVPYLEQLTFLRNINEKVMLGMLPSSTIEIYQRAFVSTLNDPLSLSPLECCILERLSISSPQAAISTEELREYSYRKYCGENGQAVYREDIIKAIGSINQALPLYAGIKIRLSFEMSDEGAYYLGPTASSILAQRDIFLLNLKIAGFSHPEISSRASFSESRTKEEFSKIYKRLGVHSLGASLLICDDGLVDEIALAERIPVANFTRLTDRQKEILDVLVEGEGRTDKQIASHLNISVNTVKNLLYSITRRLESKGFLTRIGVGIGYRLYKDAPFNCQGLNNTINRKTISNNQLRVLALAGLGLPYKEIGNKLGLSLNTVKNHSSQAFNILGVKSQTGATLELLKRRMIDPFNLVDGFNLSLFERLSSRQINFIELLVENTSPLQAIADLQNRSKRTVKKDITEIATILGISEVSNLRLRILVLYLAYKQQKQESAGNNLEEVTLAS